jgi:hypothetical protein
MIIVMCSSGRCYSLTCSCIGIFISLIIGVVIGLLNFFAVIAVTTSTLWIVVALALVLLFFVLLALLLSALSVNTPLTDCLCQGALILLAAIVGTLILALILSFVSLASIIAASILIGIAAFFVALMILATLALAGCILCAVRC